MDQCIMIGCDLHDANMLLKVAVGREAPETRAFRNDRRGREELRLFLRRRAAALGGARMVFAYEASGQGYQLYDELTAAGVESHVLAPSRLSSSPHARKRKTDERDAERILEAIRAHVLAGNLLPRIWVPDRQTRADRELVRARLDLGEQAARLKTQVSTLLKLHGVARPKEAGGSWTVGARRWLAEVAAGGGGALAESPRRVLESLLRRLACWEEEIERLDHSLSVLAEAPRYQWPVRALVELCGVGVLTALVFLTELGDLRRFHNRREIGSYLGLVPSSHESGESRERKGHITRQGSPHLRKVLCQAVWARMCWDGPTQEVGERIAQGDRRRKKVAVVALMRRLAVVMWHLALAAQERAGCFAATEEPEHKEGGVEVA
jgi:transposase